MNILILEFVELDDFLAHLKEDAQKHVRLEIDVESGNPSGQFEVSGVRFRAVATAIVNGPHSIKVVARWEHSLLLTNSLHLRIDRDESRSRLFENFDKLKAHIEERGFEVKRGMWSPQT